MIEPDRLRAAFDNALPYDAYVATGTPQQRENWARIEQSIALTPGQVRLVASFVRSLNILVLSGTWCGDCAAQCPMLHRIAQTNPARIALRLLDRDAHPDLAASVRICGGPRVPTALFLNEDFEFVSILGDRTLARYRAMAARQLGPACPLPGAPIPPDELAATLQDWLNEVERVQLLLRLSPKLRKRYSD